MAARKTQTAKKTTRKLSTAKSSVTAKKKAPVKKVLKVVSKAKPKAKAKLSLVKTPPLAVGKKPFTKAQFISTIAEQTDVNKKSVELVLSTVSKIIHLHLKKQGPEMFSWPGLFKIMVVKKPATPEKWGINPFTKEKMKFKAKPASRRIKVRALKGLKEMAQ